MSPELPGVPAPSGARLGGDDYQHLLTWKHALALLRNSTDVTRVEFEVRGAGNVDDLVVLHRTKPAVYHQIKFSVDQRNLLTHEWFTTAPDGAKRSPLERFHDSFRRLSNANGPPEMALLTSKQMQGGDPVLRHLDGRTDKLSSRLFGAGPQSASGKARQKWAASLGVTDDELKGMLAHLRIYPGLGSLSTLRSDCCAYMEAAGLRGDDDAITLGAGELRKLIINGCSALERPDVQELATRLRLDATSPRALLVIQAIDHHPWPTTGIASVDWVDEFIGDEVRERRRTSDPSAWNRRFKPELQQAVQVVRGDGFKNIRIDGAFRLSTGFAAGVSAPRTAGLFDCVP